MSIEMTYDEFPDLTGALEELNHAMYVAKRDGVSKTTYNDVFAGLEGLSVQMSEDDFTEEPSQQNIEIAIEGFVESIKKMAQYVWKTILSIYEKLKAYLKRIWNYLMNQSKNAEKKEAYFKKAKQEADKQPTAHAYYEKIKTAYAAGQEYVESGHPVDTVAKKILTLLNEKIPPFAFSNILEGGQLGQYDLMLVEFSKFMKSVGEQATMLNEQRWEEFYAHYDVLTKLYGPLVVKGAFHQRENDIRTKMDSAKDIPNSYEELLDMGVALSEFERAWVSTFNFSDVLDFVDTTIKDTKRALSTIDKRPLSDEARQEQIQISESLLAMFTDISKTISSVSSMFLKMYNFTNELALIAKEMSAVKFGE